MSTTKALAIPSPGEAVYKQVPTPAPGPGKVLIRVAPPISHRLPLEQVAGALTTIQDDPHRVKVLTKP